MKKLIPIFFCFVVVLNANAQTGTQKVFQSTGTITINDIKPLNDGGYIAGATTVSGSERVILKMDDQFNILWQKNLGIVSLSSWDNSFVIEESINGGFYFLSSSPSGSGITVTKLDANGTPTWSTNLDQTGAYAYTTSKIRESATGDFIVTHSIQDRMALVKINSSGGLVFARSFMVDTTSSAKCPGFDAELCDDTSVIISGKADSDNAFARVGASGNVIWSTIYKIGGSYNQPRSLTKMSDGSIWTAGMHMDATNDGFIAKMDLSGNITWHKTYGWGSLGLIFEKIVALSGNKAVGFGYLGSGNVVAIFDGNGNPVKSVMFGNTTLGTHLNIQLSVKNNLIYIVSDYQSNFDGLTYKSLFVLDENLNFTCTNIEITLTATTTTTTPTNIGSMQTTNYGTVTANAVSPVTSGYTLTSSEYCALLSEEEFTAETNEISIYPNPSASGIPIQLNFNISNEYRITIFDITGKLMSTKTINGKNTFIETSGFAAGTYLVKIEGNNTSETKKLMVK